jgi:GT2 family glycosyltransferase
MWRRDLHDQFGLFDETLKSSGDTEFWLRALAKGAKFVYYPEVTAVYFHNPEGLSSSLSSTGHGEWAMVRDRFLKATPNK